MRAAPAVVVLLAGVPAAALFYPPAREAPFPYPAEAAPSRPPTDPTTRPWVIAARDTALPAAGSGERDAPPREPGAAAAPLVIPRGNGSLGRETTRAVQQALSTRGFTVGAIDGVWGPGSQRALVEFQRSLGIAPGPLDAFTLSALDIHRDGSEFAAFELGREIDPEAGE